MKLFVTGGAGFIGSNYVRWVLSNTPDEVTVYDALTYAGNLASLRDVEERFGRRYRFVHADICDLTTLEEAVAGHDGVVHFAAESHVDRSIAGPGRLRSHQLRGHQPRHARRPGGPGSNESCTSRQTRCTGR